MDIASLAIQINTSDVTRAEQALEGLARAGGRAESSAEAVSDAGQRLAGVYTDAAGRLREANGRFVSGATRLELGLGDVGSAAASASAGLGRASAATDLQADIMQRAGLSAGQYQQALRMLPMQLTDVAVSVASGMPLWMVAIQQGGQVRDSFGGIGNAARAVVSTLGPMNLAIGGVAAMLGTLLIAYQQGQNEAQAYKQALILTGNAAGTSADQLDSMAERIDAVSGTQHQAAAALAEIASTGKFTADQIEAIGTAAVAMENATGKAVSDTVKDFVRLADEPAAASAKLNEQYGYLTASVYEQIAALEEQGRETEAAKLATDTFAGAMQQRSSEIEGNLGTLERTLNSLKRGWKEMWDAALDIGRPDTLDEQLASVEERLRNARNRTGRQASRLDTSELEQQREELQLSILERDAEAERAGIRAKTNQDAIEAQKEIARVREQGLSKAEKKEKEIADYRENLEKIRAANPFSPLLNQAQIDKDLAAIEEKYKETARRTKVYTDDAATRMLQQLRERGAILQEQLSTNEQLSTDQRALVEWTRQLADLKQKAVLTADQKSLLASQDTITALLSQNAALEAQRQARERLAEQAQWMATLQERVANRQNAVDIAVQGVGLGDRARREMEQVNAIQREYARSREELARQQGTVNGLPEDQFQARIDALRAAEEQEIAILQEGAQRKLEAEADWTNGARRALENYLDDARNVAEITEDLFGSAFRGMEDAVAKFASTGKLEFQDFAQSVIADMLRISAQQAASEIGSSLISSLGKSALGSLFSGAAGSNISDYTGGSFDNWVAGRRAMGGPTSPGSLYEVNERGPELYVEKGRTYLMTGANSGYVSPMEASGKAAAQDAAPIINIIEDASRAGQVSSRREDERWVTDVVVANLYQEGSVWQAISRMAGVDRKGT